MSKFDDLNDWKYEVDNGDTLLGFKEWLRHKAEANTPTIKIEKRGVYQGVPQYGITGQAEITPSRATAEKWARLEQQARKEVKKLGG